VDRHVANGRGEQVALIYDSPVTQTVQRFTFKELLSRVAKCAGALAWLGVAKGDRVIIYMPMIPEAVVAMLATARLGAIHSVVFGGFAPHELAVRIDDARPKIILTASCGIEPGRLVAYKPLVDAAIGIAKHKPERCIVYQRPMQQAQLTPPRDLDWNGIVDGATVASTDPLYILYTSGTTGQPKGIVRDNGGHLVALNWSMRHIYGVEPGEVFWAASDIGWVVGHSYIVYAPLTRGCTTVLFEGKPVGNPDAGVFWRVISDHNVACLFTAPTAFRAIKREDPKGGLLRKYTLSKFRTLFLAGERLDPDTLRCAGPKTCCRFLSSTTGGKPKPAGRYAPTVSGWKNCRSSRDPQRNRFRGGGLKF
jgi:propionyl-CoA synthetase